jgi:hypothetical protein
LTLQTATDTFQYMEPEREILKWKQETRTQSASELSYCASTLLGVSLQHNWKHRINITKSRAKQWGSRVRDYSNTYLLTLWRYSSCRTLATSHILCEVSWQQIFTGWGHQPHAQPPNLEDQGISLSVAPPSKPVRHGWSHQQLCCCWHSFRLHWCTQAPSPSNKELLTRWRYHWGGQLTPG